MPAISDIPNASGLQAQLANLNAAIAALQTDGTTVTNMVVMPGADPAQPTQYVASIGLTLDPPISDPATLAALTTALQSQAATVTQQLVNMGYSDDSGTVTRQGPVPAPPPRPPAPTPASTPAPAPAVNPPGQPVPEQAKIEEALTELRAVEATLESAETALKP